MHSQGGPARSGRAAAAAAAAATAASAAPLRLSPAVYALTYGDADSALSSSTPRI
jgi:hypothetical protein